MYHGSNYSPAQAPLNCFGCGFGTQPGTLSRTFNALFRHSHAREADYRAQLREGDAHLDAAQALLNSYTRTVRRDVRLHMYQSIERLRANRRALDVFAVHGDSRRAQADALSRATAYRRGAFDLHAVAICPDRGITEPYFDQKQKLIVRPWFPSTYAPRGAPGNNGSYPPALNSPGTNVLGIHNGDCARLDLPPIKQLPTPKGSQSTQYTTASEGSSRRAAPTALKRSSIQTTTSVSTSGSWHTASTGRSSRSRSSSHYSSPQHPGHLQPEMRSHTQQPVTVMPRGYHTSRRGSREDPHARHPAGSRNHY
ncbi:uncharacterized protein BXZ73DRAFT_78141 [Epithele typhae]|uniref:uncharacterized protein n=1 Tax=Epithele typhae TaxID=378194 RepID=UPI002008C07F|nr:uncharacterized protein BXZ73DRAFT_78141 [Epithele typhae]KAH9929595.1 hypothetical protein BXZ73DRAFT_78141 [Epithele typhae]